MQTDSSQENKHLAARIEELEALNASYFNQGLLMGRRDLETERNIRQYAVAAAQRHQQELISCRTALAAAQTTLEVKEHQLKEMALELDRTQRKFHLVDTLVDTMLLEEDSQLEMTDRSRQITDVILGLENQMEARYRSFLAEKDSEILTLRHILEPEGEGNRVRRARSEPSF
ncbi:hypothetical protein BDV32DRAFT_155379 [Aspergillus pseudonomiae]|uniref:Uncharacterized protein n=1 Tax=Aspergillus pseudonomiae TaxID=1506151 RepID=A0A5N7CV01_9EURO|nr:uncharacterized protein BDV37DRAFT_288932 [Aspergillus pseudonomiae]KAB8254285.1 hypothetical protein BDV32DRAFT_155379 [Aspergillus pseudonomiae]KAE8398020.1 hypothetical protein BDV37DRAFT_288932 [Aspergillus pseudonomiae]